jgi:hypothetical protein
MVRTAYLPDKRNEGTKERKDERTKEREDSSCSNKQRNEGRGPKVAAKRERVPPEEDGDPRIGRFGDTG